MATPNLFAIFITSSSLIDPPGCIMLLTPTPAAISTQSGKGKNASDAIIEPCKSNPLSATLLIAIFTESMRDICPAPTLNN